MSQPVGRSHDRITSDGTRVRARSATLDPETPLPPRPIAISASQPVSLAQTLPIEPIQAPREQSQATLPLLFHIETPLLPKLTEQDDDDLHEPHLPRAEAQVQATSQRSEADEMDLLATQRRNEESEMVQQGQHSQQQPSRLPSLISEQPIASSSRVTVEQQNRQLSPPPAPTDGGEDMRDIVAPSDVDVVRPSAHPAQEVPAELLQPSPPRRALRSRKPGQLHPYTVEMAIYKRRLERNDWEDAVVTSREFRRRLREEQERAQANELPLGGEDDDADLREAEAAKRRERKKQRQIERDERRKQAQEAARAAIEAEIAEESGPTASKRPRTDNRPRPQTAPKDLFAPFGGLLSDSDDDMGAATAADPQAGSSRPTAAARRARYGKQSHTAGQADGSASDASSTSSGPLRPDRGRHRQARVSSSSSGEEGNRPTTQRAQTISDSSSSSSEEEVDYDRYFRKLKRMMPIGMARKHIEDLKNMRKGKDYHSDGHVSATPGPSDRGSGSETEAANTTMTPASSPPPQELQPGETRKTVRQASELDDAKFQLVGDEESDSGQSVISLSSTDDRAGERDGDITWWAVPEKPSKPRREEDEIDRMLSRSSGIGSSRRSRASKGPARSKGTSRRQAASSSGFRSSKGVSRPFAERTLNQGERRSAGGSSSAKKRKRQSGQGSAQRLPRPYAPPSRTLGINPPVVQPRLRRPLDLLSDDAIFDLELMPEPPVNESSVAEREEQHQAALQSYRSVNRPNRPIMRRKRTPEVVITHAGRQHRVSDKDQQHPQSPILSESRSFQRTASRTSIGDSSDRSTSKAAESPRAPASTTRTVQSRLDGYRTFQRTTSADAQKASATSPHQLDANAWADLDNLRLDFGIRPLPAGISFSPASAIGRGRLFELVNLPEASPAGSNDAARSRAVYALDLQLPAQTSLQEFLDLLPLLFDAIFSATETIGSSSESADRSNDSRLRNSIDEALRWLNVSLSMLLTELPWNQARQAALSTQGQLDRLFERFGTADIGGGSNGDRDAQARLSSLLLSLRWFNVELSWRTLICRQTTPEDIDEASLHEEDFVLGCQGLMVALLSLGLHHATKHCKQVVSQNAQQRLSQADDTQASYEATEIHLTDYSAELWVSLIHLLRVAATLLGPHAGFWVVFEEALAQWRASLPPRRKVLTAEMIWFSILSLCALSQFSASTGTSGSTPQLSQHWPLVAKALTATRLRYEEKVEQAMPSAAVAKRDQYVRAVLQRCFNLASLWHWSMDGADAVISKIFDVFDAHKLADLPSEQDHDFPPFLRDYDAKLLFDESKREATAYHVFLKLLARAARESKAMAKDDRDAERRVSRLFSRVCPVRVMTFTRDTPPTARERSSLFNHYSVVMIHLYLVPAAAAQRLRQIKSFLVFKDADAQSQVTCIRAMLYAAVIYRHHNLDIAPIMLWFSNIFKTLLVEAEQTHRKAVSNQPGEHFETLRQAKRLNSLLIASLRSIQHIIQHRSMDADLTPPPQYPDQQLLDRAWIADVLETQTAVDPTVGMEVLKCIQTYLLQRNAIIDGASESQAAPSAAQPSSSAAQVNHESQDSFGDLFEDGGFDFADPALAGLLDDGNVDNAANVEAARTHLRELDSTFAQQARASISPALFTLISNVYHPDRASEGRRISLGISDQALPSMNDSSTAAQRQQMDVLLKQTTRRRYVEMLIDCWAGCAHVLVQNGLRDWSSYLTYGNESWKRLEDAVARRDVGLRFLQNVVSLDPAAYWENQAEFIQVWFQSLAAKSLSIQADYTRTLFQKIDPGMPWFYRCPLLAQDGSTSGSFLSLERFQQHRASLLSYVLSAMRRDYEGTLGIPDPTPSASHSAAPVISREEARRRRRSIVFTCLSGFLSTMRAHLEEIPSTPLRTAAGLIATENTEKYLVFCEDAIESIGGLAGDTILRGVKAELERTKALVRKLIEQYRVVPLDEALGF